MLKFHKNAALASPIKLQHWVGTPEKHLRINYSTTANKQNIFSKYSINKEFDINC